MSSNPVDTTQTIAEEIYKRNRQLLEERRHAEKLLYNVSEGVFAVDNDYNLTIFNRALEKMLGLTSGMALGRKMEDVIKIETEQGEDVDLRQYCFVPPQKTPTLYNVVLKGVGKTYFVNVKFSLIASEVNPEDSESLVTITDITNEIMLDKAKDDFLSLATHELKTPLTIVKDYLWMVLHKPIGDINEKQSKYLTTAYKSTERMISMITDMLNISRLEQGRLEFDMKGLKIIDTVKEVMKDFEMQVQDKGLFLKLDSPGIAEDQIAYYDDNKLKECLENFIGNAVKFTVDGGITVSIENMDMFLKISVRDSGVGISEEDEQKLFSKFGKGESSYLKATKTGGTGLGLYIVKIYVEAMGGEVGYESAGDYEGSTFWLTIPKHVVLHD